MFGKAYTYRIGGDEFVAIGYDWPETEEEKIVEKLKFQINEAGYSAAIGYHCEILEGIHIQNIVKEGCIWIKKCTMKQQEQCLREAG